MAESAFRLYLLGRFRLEKNGRPLDLTTRKIEALLAYLALHSGPHSREELAALFWGDVTDTKARASLRNALPILRKHLGATAILADRATVQLADSLWVDALIFRQEAQEFLQTAIPHTKTPRPDLYRGDLLTGFYEDWVIVERENLRQLYLDLLLKMAQQARALAQYARAITLAQQLLTHEPTAETAHQLLMSCYFARGEREAALRQYELCHRLLADELAVAPQTATTALYNTILQANPQRPPAQATVGNIPIPHTSFIGRQKETVDIHYHLQHSRLVTLTGPGGSGKTRLAIQAALELNRHQSDIVPRRFPDGIWWVELAHLTDPTFVPQAILKTLGVIDTAVTNPQDLLQSYLTDRQCLTILDNCEHLILACAQLCQNLLSTCPHLSILITSRESLDIMGETIYPVPPLTLPQRGSDTAESEAVQLFVARAATASPTFTLTPHNTAAIAQLCQQLDGLPLALELAAAQSRIFSPAQIVARLHDRFNLLTSGNRAALPHQQTLRATLDWSYDLLDTPEKRLFRRLAVFSGSFTLEAVTVICSLDAANHLGRLLNKSFLSADHHVHGTRYYLLQTIRQYAADRLSLAGEETDLYERHLNWYMQLAEQAEPELLGHKQLDWLTTLEAEQANLLAALQWAETNGHFRAALRLCGALWRFWDQRGNVHQVRQQLEKILATNHTNDLIQAKALLTAGILAYLQTDNETAVNHLQQSLTIYQQHGDLTGWALAQHHLGFTAHRRGDFATARHHYQVALNQWQQQDHAWGMAETTSVLGQLAFRAADYTTAYLLQRQSLEIRQQLGDQRGIIFSLWCLGNVAYAQQDYLLCRQYNLQALTLAQMMDDKWSLPFCLEALAYTAAAQAQWQKAAHLLAIAEKLRQTSHTPLPAVWQETFKQAQTNLQSHFGQSFAQIWQQGHEMDLATAVTLALHN